MPPPGMRATITGRSCVTQPARIVPRSPRNIGKPTSSPERRREALFGVSNDLLELMVGRSDGKESKTEADGDSEADKHARKPQEKETGSRGRRHRHRGGNATRLVEPWRSPESRGGQFSPARDATVEEPEAGSREGRYRGGDKAGYRPVRAQEEGHGKLAQTAITGQREGKHAGERGEASGLGAANAERPAHRRGVAVPAVRPFEVFRVSRQAAREFQHDVAARPRRGNRTGGQLAAIGRAGRRSSCRARSPSPISCAAPRTASFRRSTAAGWRYCSVSS